MVSATVDATGWSVLVAFDDRPTNRAGMEDSTAPCSVIFTDATESSFRGSSTQEPRCTWIDQSSVRVLLPSLTALRIGTAVTVRNDTVHPYAIGTHVMTSCVDPSDGLSKCAHGAVLARAPSSAIAPTAHIDGPTRLSTCSDLTLSGLGSFGGGAFPLSYAWSTTWPSLGWLLRALPSSTSQLRVPSHLLPPNATFSVTLRVTTAAVGTSSEPVNVTIFTAGSLLFETFIEGGMQDRHVTRDEPLSLVGVVTVPSRACAGSEAGMAWAAGLQLRYAWQVERLGGGDQAANVSMASDASVAAVVAANADRRELRISKDVLLAGASYRFMVTSMPVGTIGPQVLGSSASLTVHVHEAVLRCEIAGGSRRTAGAGTSLVLHAELMDPDEPAVPPLVEWGCVDEQAELAALASVGLTGTASTARPPCYVAACSDPASTAPCTTLPLGGLNASSGTLAFAPGTLSVGSVFRFTATSTKGNRSAHSSSTVEVVADTPPDVDVRVRSAVEMLQLVVGSERLVNPQQKNVLEGITRFNSSVQCGGGAAVATCGATFAWSSPPGLAISAQRLSLSIPADVLMSGQAYTFRLSVSAPGAGTGVAELTVRASEPPYGGTVVATPPRGTLLNTPFELVQTGWFAEEHLLPLKFVFEGRVELEGAGTTISPGCGLVASAGQAQWTVLGGPQTAPFHVEPHLPLGNVTIRAVAVDALGVRGCASTNVVVELPEGCETSCIDAMATSLYSSTLQAVAGGYAARLPQTVNLLSDLLALSAASDNETDVLLNETGGAGSGRRLSDERVGMRDGLVGFLEESMPLDGDQPVRKLQFALSLSKVVASDEVSEEAAVRSTGIIGGMIRGLGLADGGTPVDQSLLRSIGSVLAADMPTLPPEPPEPPWPPAPPFPSAPPPPPAPPQQPFWLRSRRALSADRAAGSLGGDLKQLAFNLADHVAQQLIIGETPAEIDPDDEIGVALGVMRMPVEARNITLRAPALARAYIGELALASTIESAQIRPDDDLQIDLVDFPTSPGDRPPPRDDGLPTPKVASAILSMRMKANGVHVPPVGTVMPPPSPPDGSSSSLVVDVDDVSATNFVLPRQATTFQCGRDYQCRGPIGTRVDGRCVNNRCQCPLPWAGKGCKSHTRCAWWANEGNWSYSHCVLDLGTSDDATAVCRCALSGTIDLAVVEQSGRVNNAIISFNLGDWEDFEEVMLSIQDQPIVAILVVTVDLLWLIIVIVSKCRGNENERRMNKEYYAFWAAQHKHRVSNAKKPKLRKRIWAQVRAQHKLVRIFFHQYELGEDPAKIPTGAQKTTTLAIILQFKMLCIAMLWQQAKSDDVGFTITQRVVIGSVAALITMPATVFLDQLFWRQQRITNSAPAGEGKSSGAQMIAKAAMHVAINHADTLTALLAWRTAVEDMRVAEIQAKLMSKRLVAVVAFSQAEEAKAEAKERPAALAAQKSGKSSLGLLPGVSTSNLLRGGRQRSSARIAPEPLRKSTTRPMRMSVRFADVGGAADDESEQLVVEDMQDEDLTALDDSAAPSLTQQLAVPVRGSPLMTASFADVRTLAVLFGKWRGLPAALLPETFHRLSSFQGLGASNNRGLQRSITFGHQQPDESLRRAYGAFALAETYRKSAVARNEEGTPRDVHSPDSGPLDGADMGWQPPPNLRDSRVSLEIVTPEGFRSPRVSRCCFPCCCWPQPKCWRWWLRVWRSSVAFWRIFPWAVTVPLLFITSFLALFLAQSIFRDDPVYVFAFCESLGISLGQSWCFQDVLVISIRNNVSCFGMKAKIRSYRYQAFEKILLAPLLIVKKMVSSAFTGAG